MRFFLLIGISLLLLIYKGQGQGLPANFNLVPNSSFEYNFDHPMYAQCADTSFVDNDRCWINADGIGGFPFPISDPIETRFPKAFKGRKYTGMMFLVEDMVTLPDTTRNGYQGYRNYLETRLMEPLEAGVTYFFSMQVGFTWATSISLAGKYNLITNIGALFTNEVIHSPPEIGVPIIPATPQLNFREWPIASPRYDTFQYVRLSGAYTATGGEQYLTIGNFDSIKYFNVVQILPNTSGNVTTIDNRVSYYLDDIRLLRDTVNPIISIDNWSLGNDTVICVGPGSDPPVLSLGGQEYYFAYQWSTGDTTASIQVMESGTYWCRVDFGCSQYTDTVQVTYLEDELPVVALGNDTSICNAFNRYDTLTLYAPDCDPCEKRWSTGEIADAIRIDQPGNYWLTLSGVCGTRSDTITILGCPAQRIDGLMLPNAFSPNGDGLNDIFLPAFPAVQITYFEMQIFNRWGQKLATIHDIDKGWDGGDTDVGNYYYLIRYMDNTNASHMIKGDVLLLR